MDVQGQIKVIGKTETFGEKGFRKREIVVTTNEQFPQHIPVEFVQDKCDILDGYKVGESVTIGINPRGRMWTNPQGVDKYFLSFNGWKINRDGAAAPGVPQPAFEAADDLNEEDYSDLPF